MSFPFKAMCKGVRDKARAAKATFPGGALPGSTPIEYDDAWSLAIQAGEISGRCPGIWISTAEYAGQRGPCRLDGESIIVATWVDTIERYQKSAETISDVMGWLGALAFEEDLDLSTYVSPDDGGASQMLEVYPVFIRNFTDLHHLGVIGAQAGYQFKTAHHFNLI